MIAFFRCILSWKSCQSFDIINCDKLLPSQEENKGEEKWLIIIKIQHIVCMKVR